MLFVSEIFHSIQGEGPRTGTPTVFLRLAACNLRCTWCDTPYALERKQGKESGIEEILKEIKSYDCQNLVLTGGEPMIQQGMLKDLLSEMDDFFIEIETNGCFASEIDQYIDQYNCSPKLPHSGNKEYELKILPSDKVWYKFVIDNDEEYQSTLKYIEAYKLPKERIQMMPQGRTKRELEEKSPWLIEKCKQDGYIFCPRLHIMIWDDERAK